MDVSLPLRENEPLICSENINSTINNVISNEPKTINLTKSSETANDSLSAHHQQRLSSTKNIIIDYLNAYTLLLH